MPVRLILQPDDQGPVSQVLEGDPVDLTCFDCDRLFRHIGQFIAIRSRDLAHDIVARLDGPNQGLALGVSGVASDECSICMVDFKHSASNAAASVCVTLEDDQRSHRRVLHHQGGQLALHHFDTVDSLVQQIAVRLLHFLDIVHSGGCDRIGGGTSGVGGDLAQYTALGSPDLKLGAHQGLVVDRRHLGYHDAGERCIGDAQDAGRIRFDLHMVVGLIQDIAAGSIDLGDNVVARRQRLRKGDTSPVCGVGANHPVGVQFLDLKLSALQVLAADRVSLQDLDGAVLVVFDDDDRLLALRHFDLSALIDDRVAVRGLGLDEIVGAGAHIYGDKRTGGVSLIVAEQLIVLVPQLKLCAGQRVLGGRVHLTDCNAALGGVGNGDGGGLALLDLDPELILVEHIANGGLELLQDVPARIDASEVGLTVGAGNEGIADLLAVHGKQSKLSAGQRHLALGVHLLHHQGGLLVVLQLQQRDLEILHPHLMPGVIQQVALRGLDLLDIVVAGFQPRHPDVAILASHIVGLLADRRAVQACDRELGALQGQPGHGVLLEDGDAARLIVPEQDCRNLAGLQGDILLGVFAEQVALRGLDLLDHIVAGEQVADAGQAVQARLQSLFDDLAVHTAQLEHGPGHRQAGLLILLADVQGRLAVVAEDQEYRLCLSDAELKGLGRRVNDVPVRGLHLLDHIGARLQAVEGGVAGGSGDQVGDEVAAGSGHHEAGACQRQASLVILFQDDQLGVLIVVEVHDDRIMGVHQLDQPGFAVNDVAVRDPRLNDLVPAGDCVRQMDDTVGISGIGTGLVAGIGGIVAIAQVPDGEFYSSQRLAGDGVMLGDGEALTGLVLHRNLDDPVAHRGNGDRPLMGVRHIVSGGRGELCQLVGAVGQILEQQLAVGVGGTLTADGAAGGRIVQVDGLQLELGICQPPGVGGVRLDDQQVAVVGIREVELQQ